MIRYIAVVDPAERAEILRDYRLEPTSNVISLTVLWDAHRRVGNVQVGAEFAPRTLYSVLVHSLRIPRRLLVGLSLAHDIALPGDWVVRPGADPGEYLTYVAEAVREAGHPNFAFVREAQSQIVYHLDGTPCQGSDIIPLYAPLKGAEPAPAREGTIGEFVRALSAAIGARIEHDLAPDNATRVTWRDNSFAYYQLGNGPGETQVSTLLEMVAFSLGVSFTKLEREQVVWRLSDEVGRN
ncbi:MAG: hypothetical protein KKB50_15745 [Planctomycetes bacterium]|nr:hypothetical protein [Planctomycetota bacterium]